LVGTSDIKIYKSSNNSLGGAITATEVPSDKPNGIFGAINRTTQVNGGDNYACVYVKNTNTTDKANAFSWWLINQRLDGLIVTKWAKDPTGKNGVAEAIPNVTTAPTSVPASAWQTISNTEPVANFSNLSSGDFFPIWIWRHILPNAEPPSSMLDDGPLFEFAFDIPNTGTGTGTGGGGAELDKFGLKNFYKTKVGGEEWFSDSWANGHSRDLTEGTTDGMWDPDENEKVGVAKNGAVIFRINGDGTATCGPGNATTSGQTCRIFVKKGAVGWCNTEFTMAVRVRVKTQSIQMRSRANHHGVKDLPYGYDVGHDTSCGFGNYMTKWGDDDASPDITAVWNQVEVIQDLYSSRLNQGTWPGYTLNSWHVFKNITRTVGDTVVVQAWRNQDPNDQSDAGWVKDSEFTYTGTNLTVDQTTPPRDADIQRCLDADGSLFGGDQIAGDINGNTRWLNPSYWSWIRIDETVQDVDLKWVSVREIDPGAGTGTGGGGGNPTPTPIPNWKIAVVGDWGTTSITQKVHDLCKNYDYIIAVGDNGYGDTSGWTSMFSDLKSKMTSAFGNHEKDDGYGPYKTFFGYNNTYFSVNWNNVHILVIDTNIDLSTSSAQYQFVVNDLNANDTNPNTVWTVAVMHHPWFGSTSKHGYDDFQQVERFHSLFMQHNVTLVLTGHNHNWQRSSMVAYNSSSPKSPDVVSSTSPFTASTQGLIEIISGTGGHDSASNLYGLSSQPSFMGYQNNTHNGIWEMLASNNGHTLTCSFVDVGGSKFDTIVINT